MLNFSDARSYGMVSHTFRLTYSPANEVFFVVFDIYLLSTTVFYSVCQISSTTEQRIFSIASLF